MYCASYSQATAGIAVQTFVCLLCDFLSLPRNYRRKVHDWVSAVNLYYLSMDILSLLGCFCTLLFGFFLSYVCCERSFFPWVHWPCIHNKFWCHWLSFRLAHPNTLFAIYLVPSIRPVVYGILLHAYIASYCCIVLAPVIHTLPAPSCCLAQAYGLSVVCLHAVPQMRAQTGLNRSPDLQGCFVWTCLNLHLETGSHLWTAFCVQYCIGRVI